MRPRDCQRFEWYIVKKSQDGNKDHIVEAPALFTHIPMEFPICGLQLANFKNCSPNPILVHSRILHGERIFVKQSNCLGKTIPWLSIGWSDQNIRNNPISFVEKSSKTTTLVDEGKHSFRLNIKLLVETTPELYLISLSIWKLIEFSKQHVFLDVPETCNSTDLCTEDRRPSLLSGAKGWDLTNI